MPLDDLTLADGRNLPGVLEQDLEVVQLSVESLKH